MNTSNLLPANTILVQATPPKNNPRRLTVSHDPCSATNLLTKKQQLTAPHDFCSAADLLMSLPNPNIPPSSLDHSIEYLNNLAFQNRKLFTVSLSYYEGEALRKIPVYDNLGRYTSYSPYFPCFQERYVGAILLIINRWAFSGTFVRMLRNPLFRNRVTCELLKNKTIVLSRNHQDSAKITTYKCDTGLVKHLRVACPALYYFLKDKAPPAPPVLLTYTEEQAWLNEATEIDGHGMGDIVTHAKQAVPYVMVAVAYGWSPDMNSLVRNVVRGLGVYSLAQIAIQNCPVTRTEAMDLIPKALGAGVAMGAASAVSSVLLPIQEFYNTVDKLCCEYLPLWAKLPTFLRNVLISFVGACSLYAMFRAGATIGTLVNDLVSKWIATDNPRVIDGHALTPIMCACALFAAVSSSYSATQSMNMFRNLYTTTKTLESDFNVETSLKKWTNSVFKWIGYESIFDTADLTMEWDTAYSVFQEIEHIEDLEGAMVTDHSLPQRLREITKTLNDIERCMRSSRQVPANYKTTASVVCLRAMRLLKDVVRKNSRYSDRKEPIWLDIRGAPGVGKTVSAEALLATVFQLLFNRPIGPADRCSKAPSSQYWNGYHESVWVVVMHELCTCLIPDKNLPDVSFLLHAVGKDFCPLDMADVESKGTMGFCSPVILSTGNGDFGVAPIASKGALRRRITFPVTVEKTKEMPPSPRLSDFDDAWDFVPSEEWIKQPEEYIGVWHELNSETPLQSRKWKFSQMVGFILNALKASQDDVSFASLAPELAVDFGNLLPPELDAHAAVVDGNIYTFEDYTLITHRNGAIYFDPDLDITVYEDTNPIAQQFEGVEWVRSRGDYTELEAIFHVLGGNDQVYHVENFTPVIDSEDMFEYVSRRGIDFKSEYTTYLASESAISVRNMWGTYVQSTWSKMFAMGVLGTVGTPECVDPEDGYPIRMLDQDGGEYRTIYLSLQQVVKLVELDVNIIFIEGEIVPYATWYKPGHMDEVVSLAGKALRSEDSAVGKFVSDTLVKSIGEFYLWSKTLNVETVIAIAVGVPIVISGVMALYGVMQPHKNLVRGESWDKCKPDAYDHLRDEFASKKSRRHIKVAPVWESRPHPKNNHVYNGHELDWHDMSDDDGAIHGHSGNDPTGFIRNLRKICVAGTQSLCWGLFIDSTTMISVRHVFYNGGALSVFTTSGTQKSTTYNTDQFSVVASEGNDLVLIRFKTPIVGVRSIMKRIAPKMHVPSFTRRISPVKTNGVITSAVTREASVQMVDGSFVIRQVPADQQYPVTYYAQVNDPGSAVGDCGLPYVDNIGGSDFIIGMHFGGNHGIACMTLISQDLLTYLIKHAPQMEISAEASPLKDVMLYDTIPVVPGADVAGILDPEKCPTPSSPPNKMHLTELQTANAVPPPPMTLTSKPASLRGPIARKATNYMKRGSARVDPLMETLLKENHWLLDSVNWTEMHRTPLLDPLSIKPHELLLGRDGFIDGMNDKTSVGPMFKRKIYTLDGKPVQSKKELWCLEDNYVNPTFLKMCTDRVNKTRRGIFTPTVVEARYKQELRDVEAKGITLGFLQNEEIFAGKYDDTPPPECDQVITGLVPREFYVSCPIDNFETRALMWPYMKRKHELTTCNTCQVGMNPYSMDWKILDDRTSRYRNLIIMDVKGCDKTVMRLMAPSMERLFVHAYKANDNPKMKLWIKTQIAKMFSFEVITPVEVNGEVVEAVLTFNETVPSGLWVTTEMDGNWVYFLYRLGFEYLQVLNQTSFNFNDEVVLVTYGDDNVASVSDNVKQWYNRETLSRFCYEQFGVVMTSLRKVPVLSETPILPFDKMEDKEFLKRKFYKDARNVAVLCPLEVSSIWNSLIWTSHKNMRPDEALPYYGQILAGALNEISLHGRHAWDNFVKHFKPKYIKLGGQWPVNWKYDKVRKSAILRSKGPGTDKLRLEYLAYMSKIPGGPLGDPLHDKFEESCVEEALVEA